MADKPAWVANYLPELIRSGISATQALRSFRAPASEGGLGLRVSTTEWYRQWGQTLNRLSAAEGFLAVNLARRPSDEHITPLTSRKATGYNYTFDVLVKNNSTGETYYTPSGYRSDTLVSWGKAKQRAMDALTAAVAEYTGTGQDIEVLGALPTAVVQYVPGG